MRRREFITLLGGTAAGWPIAVRAQQPERTRRIGVLVAFTENDPATKERLAAFRQGLERRGWFDGRNIHLDYRFTADRTQQFHQFTSGSSWLPLTSSSGNPPVLSMARSDSGLK